MTISKVSFPRAWRTTKTGTIELFETDGHFPTKAKDAYAGQPRSVTIRKEKINASGGQSPRSQTLLRCKQVITRLRDRKSTSRYHNRHKSTEIPSCFRFYFLLLPPMPSLPRNPRFGLAPAPSAVWSLLTMPILSSGLYFSRRYRRWYLSNFLVASLPATPNRTVCVWESRSRS